MFHKPRAFDESSSSSDEEENEPAVFPPNIAVSDDSQIPVYDPLTNPEFTDLHITDKSSQTNN